MQLSDYQLQVQELVHDTAAIDFTLAELTNFINNSRNRVALDFHSVRQILQNASLIAQQEQYPMFGGIVGLTIANGGVNYTNPTITIGAPPAGGVQATAVAVLSSGVITQINMTNWGTLYAPTPTSPISVNVTDATGSGASLVALGTTNIFDINSISVLWGTQRYTMGWLPFTPFQAFCRSNPTLRRQPAVWTVVNETNTIFVYPFPDQAYPIDIDAIAQPTPLVNNSDVDFQVIPPWNDAVQFYAAHLAMIKYQNFGQAEYFKKTYTERRDEIQRTRQDRRIPNIYRNMWRRINRW